MKKLLLTLAFALIAGAVTTPAPLAAQQTSFVYRLGKDTVFVDQFTRTATTLTGELASRLGASVLRLQYDVTVGANGRPTAVVYHVVGGDGKPLAGRPTEIRYAVAGDSVKRTIVWPDSSPTRTFAAANPVAFGSPAYGMLELAFGAMRRGNQTAATFQVLGTASGNALQSITFNAGHGDTITQNGPAGLNIFRADKDGRLLAFDGLQTTQKFVAARATTRLNVATIAAGMKPTGVLSQRGFAHVSFGTSPVFIDYSRPQVRERTVWGGTLIPPDTIWRLGANEATHLATSRDLVFGDFTLPAGLYTIWMFNAKGAPQLVFNKQVGQWGTQYDPKMDLGRAPLTMSATPEHVEDFTITLRALGPARGAIDFAWGSQKATATFTVKQ